MGLQPGDIHYPYVPPFDTVDAATPPEPPTEPPTEPESEPGSE